MGIYDFGFMIYDLLFVALTASRIVRTTPWRLCRASSNLTTTGRQCEHGPHLKRSNPKS
jgi:hypothetical protein